MYSNELPLIEQEENAISSNKFMKRPRDIMVNFNFSNTEDNFNKDEKITTQENSIHSNKEDFILAFKNVFQVQEEEQEEDQVESEKTEVESNQEKDKILIKDSDKNQKNSDTKNTSNLSSEMEIILTENKKPLFETIYPEKVSLFPQSKLDLNEAYDLKGFVSKKRIRSTNPRKRLDYDDDTRKKITRKFFNKDLLHSLEKLFKKSKHYFTKFPQNFVGNVSKETHKNIVNMKLKEFFEIKDFYEADKLKNYFHNLKTVEMLKNENDWRSNIILNTKICDLFCDYLNSDLFKVDEINRHKKKNKSDVYIERYIYLSQHLMEFFSN